MKGKRKPAAAVGRAGSPKADLGQKEARLEKKQAELEEASEAQLRHMEGGKDAKAASRRKRKFSLNNPRPPSLVIGQKVVIPANSLHNCNEVPLIVFIWV